MVVVRRYFQTMATPTLDPKTSDTVQALVQLLRSRSSEEIRQRMYDNPPGSPWWAACKTELDLRNSERAATALVDTSRVLDKLRSATDHLDELTDKLLQATTDMSEVVKSVRESGRRMEIATYVIVGLTIVPAVGQESPPKDAPPSAQPSFLKDEPETGLDCSGISKAAPDIRI